MDQNFVVDSPWCTYAQSKVVLFIHQYYAVYNELKFTF